MRNHREKTRDIARSVLPSTSRKAARNAKARVHGAERVRLRRELHALGRLEDPDDYEGDLMWQDLHEMRNVVADRRAFDKVGPLMRWANRTIERNPALGEASRADREVYFRRILPKGLVGNHAITHLYWVLDEDLRGWTWTRPDEQETDSDREIVKAIVAAGRHGELNWLIRRKVPLVRDKPRFGAKPIIDEEHPAFADMIAARVISKFGDRWIRLLTGSHDVDAFVEQAEDDTLQVARDYHAALVRIGETPGPSGNPVDTEATR